MRPSTSTSSYASERATCTKCKLVVRGRSLRRAIATNSRGRRSCSVAFAAIEADLVLSSGFLAFANHSGFLQAVEESGQVKVKGVMGTSAGALTGSMYSAGYKPSDILRETTRDPPWKLLRPSWKFWEGELQRLLFCCTCGH